MTDEQAWETFLAGHAERIGWDYYGEMFIPSDGSDREAEMKRQACEMLGVPMPRPVHCGWKTLDTPDSA